METEALFTVFINSPIFPNQPLATHKRLLPPMQRGSKVWKKYTAFFQGSENSGTKAILRADPSGMSALPELNGVPLAPGNFRSHKKKPPRFRGSFSAICLSQLFTEDPEKSGAVRGLHIDHSIGTFRCGILQIGYNERVDAIIRMSHCTP